MTSVSGRFRDIKCCCSFVRKELNKPYKQVLTFFRTSGPESFFFIDTYWFLLDVRVPAFITYLFHIINFHGPSSTPPSGPSTVCRSLTRTPLFSKILQLQFFWILGHVLWMILSTFVHFLFQNIFHNAPFHSSLGNFSRVTTNHYDFLKTFKIWCGRERPLQ